MITTTDYYKSHVTYKVTKWKPKVVIDYSDYNIDNTIAVSNTFDGEGSFPDQIADGIKTPTYKYFTWADFEWGCHLMGDDDQYEHGAISQQISGTDKGLTGGAETAAYFFDDIDDLGYDITDNGNDGTLTGFGATSRYFFEDDLTDEEGSHDASSVGTITYTTGLVGKAVSADSSTSNYVSFGTTDDFKIVDGCTITFAVKASAAADFARLFDRPGDWQIQSISNTLYFQIVDSSAANKAFTTYKVPYNSTTFTRAHFVIEEPTANNWQVSVYSNGTLLGSQTLAFTMNSASGIDLRGIYNFAATLDDFEFIPYAQSQAEISALYNRPQLPSYWVDGVSGKALSGNESSYVNCGDMEVAGLSEISLTGWFRSNGTVTGEQTLMMAGKNLTGKYGIGLQISGTKLRPVMADPADTTAYASEIGNTIVADGEWFFAVMTLKDSVINYYVDGVEDTNSPLTGFANIHLSTELFYIAASPYIGKYFDGSFDDIRIYNRALTEAEIKYSYDKPQILAPSMGRRFEVSKPAFYGTTFYSTEPSSLLSVYIPKPTFSVTFLERSITSLEVVFDDKLVQYAEEFRVLIYQGTTLASTETVTGNTGTTWTKTLSSQIDDVTRMDLIIDKWSNAETWARVLEFYTSVQETYLQDEVLSISISEESAPSQATTPIGNVTANSCEISLINKNGRFDNDNEDSPLQGNLIKNRRVMPYIGLVGDNDETGKQNYIPLGVFYTQGWTNNNYQLTAGCDSRDVIQLMADNEYKKSQFISTPADQDVTYTSTSDFDAFTKFNTLASNNELQFGGGKYIYDSEINSLYGALPFYGSTILSGNFYYGYAYKSFSYTYVDGTSVKLTLNATETKTDADRINYYLSFDGGITYKQITDSLTYYPTTSSASQTVYVKVEFITPSASTALSVQDIEITIQGYVSLYSLATKVLNDFDDVTNILEGNYDIDNNLGSLNIPNAYLEPQSYLDALRLICEAGAAMAYSTRTGTFVIERVDSIVDYELSRDNTSYFNAENKTNPQDLINRVTVNVQPLTQGSSQTIAELSETATASTDTVYTIFYTSDPCDDVSFAVDPVVSGVTVTDEVIYTWGAEVTITNTNGTDTEFKVVGTGKPYGVEASFDVQLDDSESIRRSGVQETIINNPLIQTTEQAEDIAEVLIGSYKNQKRLVSADIVPDPSLEISDGVSIDSKGYKVYSQDIIYSDGLSHNITGVKQ